MKKILTICLLFVSFSAWANQTTYDNQGEWNTVSHPDGSSTTYGPNGYESNTYSNNDGTQIYSQNR